MGLDERSGVGGSRELNGGEFDGAESPVHGDAALELPLTETWAAVERDLAESEEEEKREAKENKRLIPLRQERLKKVLAQLSPEQWKAVEEIMFDGGAERLWDVRQTATSDYRERDAALEQREYEKDCAEAGEAAANEREQEREALANGRQWLNEAPLWQQISGLFPDEEMGLHPNRRAQGIRRLLKKVEQLIRWEVRKAEGEEKDKKNKSPDHCVDATRRTAQWDPLRTICLYLGIAQRKLSALSREISGLAATQLCDAIKAETLRKKWKKKVAEWVAGALEKLGVNEGGSLKERAYELWRALKAEKQKSGAHRSSWAWETGFSSYTRMFRACLVCYGMAPQEMEVELIAESLGGDAMCVFGQGDSDAVRTGAEALENEGKPAEAG